MIRHVRKVMQEKCLLTKEEEWKRKGRGRKVWR